MHDLSRRRRSSLKSTTPSLYLSISTILLLIKGLPLDLLPQGLFLFKALHLLVVSRRLVKEAHHLRVRFFVLGLLDANHLSVVSPELLLIRCQFDGLLVELRRLLELAHGLVDLGLAIVGLPITLVHFDGTVSTLDGLLWHILAQEAQRLVRVECCEPILPEFQLLISVGL